MPVSTQPASSSALELRFGLEFEDLYHRHGLLTIDARFLEHEDQIWSSIEEEVRASA